MSMTERVRKEKTKENIHILKPTLSMHDNIRRLTTVETRRHLSMLSLTLMTASRGLSLPRGRTSTSSNPFVICPGVVGEGR